MEAIFIFLLLSSPAWIVFVVKYQRYSKSTYSKETKNSFLKVLRDKGLQGEYYTVQKLDKISGYHKTLVNCYIPNGKGGMSETDIVFIHETGIYVIESKNYSGWIFGKEEDRNWCQMFPNKRKEFFYNPIKQNQTHIKVLQSQLTSIPASYFKSLIVFSERCELKKVSFDTTSVEVFKRNKIGKVMKQVIQKSPKVFTQEEINHTYSTLKPYSEVSEKVKQNHVKQIKKYKS
ncbi:nuclease-related domain-containing protein [Aneurinibacillus tyrosinisolvens]|uniref:nuclease-related domain-containing protein n=1 Tax=Aneurinibacillus tyrosinisolvens TaxID=1443435 RepID=UPI00063F3DF2|nr:nuclease-related domain-containing protein [Aneurinibacillus tyrosinisolvens]